MMDETTKYMIEHGSRKVWVLASPEILEDLEKGWSRPVQAHATKNPDGSWDMTFREFGGRGVQFDTAL